MAAPKFEVPKLTGFIDVPAIKEGASAHVKSFPANAAIQEKIGFPGSPANWLRLARQGDRQDGRSAGQISLIASVHGCLRALRRMHRQVPLFHRHGRSEEYAGRASGVDAQRLSPSFHLCRQIFPVAGRCQGPDRRSAAGLVQLLLPVLRMPPLLGILPLWH